MTEQDLDNAIRKLCQLYGWMRYHTYRSTRSPAGFPDLTLVRGARLIFAELKSDSGTLTKGKWTTLASGQRKWTDGQYEWLQALSMTSAETYVWRPSQLQEIADLLA